MRAAMWARGLALASLCGLAAGQGLAQGDRELAEQALRDRSYRMAVVHYQRALQNRPGDADLLTGLAQSYVLWGKWEQARDHAESAVRVDPQNVRALLILARSDIRSGAWAAAQARFEQVLAVEPSNYEARAGVVASLRSQGDTAAAEAARQRFEQE